MDRRDDPESPNSHSDEQFQKAYEVISLSYKGDEPERLYREAIRCFDSLIEISHGHETIREFAHRRGIDMKYLVDGASFVISKMHFNPENNYYLILGLPKHATPEELSRRWKKFMLLYHPDRQVGNEEWVTERAKKVNEAYTLLKDEVKRAEYDNRLTEQMLRREAPPAPSNHHRRPAGTLTRQGSSGSSPAWNSIRPYMPKILFAIYILIALIIIGFIYIQNRSATLEAELTAAPAKTESSGQQRTAADTAGNRAAVEQDTTRAVLAVPVESKKDPAPATQETKSSRSAASPLPSIRQWLQPKETKQTQEKKQVQPEVKKDISPLPEKNVATAQLDKGLLIVPLRSVQTEQIRKEESSHKQAETQKLPAEPVKPIQEIKQQTAERPMTEQITKEEIEEFMERYVRAYSKNDLNTFLSLFSRSATENNSLTYNDMRNAYKETFSEKINYYKIANMDIKTDGRTATVSGIYTINRYIPAEDRWVRFGGKIEWKLIRESQQLRIVRTTYDK